MKIINLTRKFALLLFLLLITLTSAAQGEIIDRCPGVGIQPRPAKFEPGGIILTAFDRNNMWVLHLDKKTRYPLEGVRPCGTNCHLSPDFRWLTYLNPPDATFYKMRLDGSQRTPLAPHVTDALWWSADTLLLWTPGHQAALLAPDGSQEGLKLEGGISVQPGGRFALALRYNTSGNDFRRVLINLDDATDERLLPGDERLYFSAAAWSPDGAWLAYVAPVETGGQMSAEIFGVQMDSGLPGQWTRFTDAENAVRIGGQTPANGLSPSPDGTKLAFWVTPLTGDDLAVDTDEATLHVLDVASKEIVRYCDHTTTAHTPNPPRLVWSPDSTHLAFADNIPDDPRGFLLIALNLADGVYIELSDGLYPALGAASPIAWGIP